MGNNVPPHTLVAPRFLPLVPGLFRRYRTAKHDRLEQLFEAQSDGRRHIELTKSTAHLGRLCNKATKIGTPPFPPERVGHEGADHHVRRQEEHEGEASLPTLRGSGLA